jgi:hypothetical protein
MLQRQHAKIVTQLVNFLTSEFYGVNTAKEKLGTVAVCHSTSYHWYSDSLRAGRSGDQIPMREKFSAVAKTGSETHPVPMQWLPGHSLGYNGRGVALTTHALLAPRLKQSVEINIYLGFHALF